jgi:hypothetical protein
LPLSIANFSAKLFEKLPNPLLTTDQLRLLKYDNVISGKYKTNSDIGVPSLKSLMMKLKNMLICGEMVANFQQKNILVMKKLKLIIFKKSS